ncbi:hypothetical protein HZA55_05480 [Candidatus Poribacteria bacterium]|nr:hypothetical protein [Candidatus Poribacteria bacterium]
MDEKIGKASKCTFCIDRIKNNLEPACVKTCPTNAMLFGKKSDIYEIAERRLKELKIKYSHSNIYGIDKSNFYGGLGNIYILLEHPSYYNL